MTATNPYTYRVIISCDGEGLASSSYYFGPYTVQASAQAHIDDHGAVCTGLGEVGVTAATCHGKIYESFEWQDA